MSENKNLQILFDFMLNSDRKRALEFISSLISQGVTPETIVNEILDPALVKHGIMWGDGKLSLAQAYVSAKIAEDILMHCIESKDQPVSLKWQGAIVIGNIEDDFHSLGRKIVAIFLKASGWKVHDLGNDVVAEEFIEEALRRNASIVGVSAMMYTTALNIKKVREEIDRRGLKERIKLAVGGAVFNSRPGLAEEVGADGSADNAFSSLALMQKLMQSLKDSGGHL